MRELTKQVMTDYGLEPKLIFDIGAYDGFHAEQFRQWFPAASVVAFEASLRNYAEKCWYRLRLGITFVHAAVIDFNGSVDFHDSIGTYEGSGSALRPNTAMLRDVYPDMRFAEPYRVPAVRLDTFCNRVGCGTPDFLHIDAQGADLKIVQSLGSLRPKGIYLETSACGEYIGSPESVEVILAELAKRGYRRVEQFDNDALFLHGDA